MAFDPEKHHRRSVRLKGYDYSQAGLYFVTLCVQDMECFFGNVKDGKMVLNDAGKVVEKWYLKLPSKYLDIELGDYVVMPNHFHAIVINNGKGDPDAPYAKTPNAALVGANPCVRPSDEDYDENAGVNTNGHPDDGLGENVAPNDDILGEHMGSPLRVVLSWFKTMSTNEYIRGVKNQGWPRFRGKLWQRNYYEHIIRSQRSFENISGYIENNPRTWEEDRFYRNQ